MHTSCRRYGCTFVDVILWYWCFAASSFTVYSLPKTNYHRWMLIVERSNDPARACRPIWGMKIANNRPGANNYNSILFGYVRKKHDNICIIRHSGGCAKGGAQGVWGTVGLREKPREKPRYRGLGRSPQKLTLFVNGCLNFDVLEEKISKTTKHPIIKIMVSWRGLRRTPPHKYATVQFSDIRLITPKHCWLSQNYTSTCTCIVDILSGVWWTKISKHPHNREYFHQSWLWLSSTHSYPNATNE